MTTIIQDFKRLCATNQMENRAWNNLRAFLCLKKTKPDDLENRMEENGHLCNVYPCFYTLYGPFNKNGFRSGNVAEGMMYDAFCGDCLFYQEAFHYQSLQNKLKRARERKKAAELKFLDNFRFFGK